MKTLDVCGPTHIQSHQSHRVRLAPHTAVERATATDYGALGPRLRLVPFVVSTFGSFGAAARTFLSGLSRLQSTVPAALHEHTHDVGGATFRAIPSHCRRLFGASVGLPPAPTQLRKWGLRPSFERIIAPFAVLRDRWPDLDDFNVFHIVWSLPSVVTSEIGGLPPCKPCNGLASAARCRSLVRAACCPLRLHCALPGARCLLTARYLLRTTAAHCVPGRSAAAWCVACAQRVRAPSHCSLPALPRRLARCPGGLIALWPVGVPLGCWWLACELRCVGVVVAGAVRRLPARCLQA